MLWLELAKNYEYNILWIRMIRFKLLVVELFCAADRTEKERCRVAWRKESKTGCEIKMCEARNGKSLYSSANEETETHMHTLLLLDTESGEMDWVGYIYVCVENVDWDGWRSPSWNGKWKKWEDKKWEIEKQKENAEKIQVFLEGNKEISERSKRRRKKAGE